MFWVFPLQSCNKGLISSEQQMWEKEGGLQNGTELCHLLGQPGPGEEHHIPISFSTALSDGWIEDRGQDGLRI